jgi:hypothetical protein
VPREKGTIIFIFETFKTRASHAKTVEGFKNKYYCPFQAWVAIGVFFFLRGRQKNFAYFEEQHLMISVPQFEFLLSQTAKNFGKGGLGEKLFLKSFSPNVPPSIKL